MGASCQASPRRRHLLLPLGPLHGCSGHRGRFSPLGRTGPHQFHCSALDPCPSFFGLCTVQKKKVTRKGEKQNRKTVSKSRNRSLRNHYGNGEVTSPGKPGMKQPKPREPRDAYTMLFAIKGDGKCSQGGKKMSDIKLGKRTRGGKSSHRSSPYAAPGPRPLPSHLTLPQPSMMVSACFADEEGKATRLVGQGTGVQAQALPSHFS